MSDIIDLAKKKSEPKSVLEFLQQNSFTVYLWPAAWNDVECEIPLEWNEVSFSSDSIDLIPVEKGVYAFKIEFNSSIFPSHGYIVYFGQSGSNSNGTLRSRFKQYLRDRSKGAKRPLFQDLFDRWGEHLTFCFVPIPANDFDLNALEESFNDASIPICVVNDFSAEMRPVVRALRGRG